MKVRAQVSVEYIIMFTLALVIFIALAYTLPNQLRNSADAELVAEQSLDQLNLQLLAGSTSPIGYNSEFEFPASIYGVPITVDLIESPDNIITVSQSGKILERLHTPNFESDNSAGCTNTVGNFYIIEIERINTGMKVNC